MTDSCDNLVAMDMLLRLTKSVEVFLGTVIE